VRHRLVDHVWMEEIVVTNHLHEPSHLHLALEVDADFADLFEVKDGSRRGRDVTRTITTRADAGLRAG
jgi:glycogen debranching enzyme